VARKKNKRSKKNPTAPGAASGGGSGGGSYLKPSGPPIGKRVFQAGLAATAVAAAFFIWKSTQSVSAFEETAALGRAKLSSVITERDNGGGHYDAGSRGHFADRLPTSGQHDLRWAEPGFHDASQNKGKLVHALEHGNVVIYYDKPGAETLAVLKRWSAMFVGQWSGLVVTPSAGLGEEIILAAWTKKLRLKPFDETAAAAFIDAFRGRGPENPVR